MEEVVLKTRTWENGAIKIDATTLGAGVNVEVRIRPLDPIQRYGLKETEFKQLSNPVREHRDAVEIQRRMRAEWGE